MNFSSSTTNTEEDSFIIKVLLSMKLCPKDDGLFYVVSAKKRLLLSIPKGLSCNGMYLKNIAENGLRILWLLV